MTGETTIAARTRGIAPAQHLQPAQQLQDEIRRMAGVSLSHLGQSDGLLARCRDQRHTQRLVARLIAADATLGAALGKAVAPPRRKAKAKRRQTHEGELNCHLATLEAPR